MQKRYSLTNVDTINRGLLLRADSETQKEPNHDDDMHACFYCGQTIHRKELFHHLEKCGRHK